MIIKIKHAVHHAPLLVGSTAWLAGLEHGYVIFPFGLARQGGQSGHGAVPIKIQWGFYNHEQTVIQDLELHLEDAHLTDTC